MHFVLMDLFRNSVSKVNVGKMIYCDKKGDVLHANKIEIRDKKELGVTVMGGMVVSH